MKQSLLVGILVVTISCCYVEAGLTSAHEAIVSASAPEDLTVSAGHHQSEWIPSEGLGGGGGAHSFVAGGSSYGHQLQAGPGPAYFNPYGYHSGGGGQHVVAAPVHHQQQSIEVAPIVKVPGYSPVVGAQLLSGGGHGHGVEIHQPKKIIHQHHEHQKVIHQHHIHQHVLHEHHLHKVHLHDLHLQDQNIHQHHKHIEHVHVPIYHQHKKHALKETEEHRTQQTHGESHEHVPGKVYETKSHAQPVYAASPHRQVVKSVAPIFYKSQPVVHQPWG